MTAQREERRLAAILSADVVGYSRLMGGDESGTLARLKADREAIISPRIAEHHGRIVKLMGDGVLVEFASVIDAVQCAADIQGAIAHRGADVAAEQRIELRIGINLGDIIVDGDDIYGDGVNIAARLQEIAEPGGVCVSAKVYEEAHKRIDVSFADLGEQSFKNIAEPVHAYQIREGATVAAPVPASDDPQPHRPSLAVLPFTNLSGDPQEDYFADGITEDLITEFSRFQQLIVIARNSVFGYKGQAINVKEVGRELGVRYVLEGSVRKAGDRVRITAQLIDAASAHHLWAERYDRELEDVFAVQDEVTRTIVATLAGKLDATERRRARGEGYRTDNLEAYDLALRGRELFSRSTPKDNLAARRLYEKAIELDPDYARAYAGLAWTYLAEGETSESEPARERALECAREGVRINRASHSNYLTLGWVCLSNGLTDQAVSAIERGIELNPNDSDGLGMLAYALCMQGKPDEAIARIDEATRINPILQTYRNAMAGMAHFLAGRYQESVEAAEGMTDPEPWMSTWYAAALVHVGREEDAKRVIAEYRRDAPAHQVAGNLRRFKNDQDRERYAAALSKAGLEEAPD